MDVDSGARDDPDFPDRFIFFDNLADAVLLKI
jgi:hypothetical protein